VSDESHQGKVAVITGGGRGFGRAFGAALAARGAHVVLADIDAGAAEAAAAEIAGKGGSAAAVACDVADEAAVAAAFGAVAERHGGIDVLVNNAGMGTFCEVANQAPEDWREVVETNLTGVFHCCRAAIPHLRRRGGGWIVNIGSLAGKNPFRGGAAYCASKAGLGAFSEALMQEVRYEDIRVSCIMPGSVRTEFAGTHQGAGSEWKLDPDDVARVVADLLEHDPRSLPSRVEIRPSKPAR
jgi:3-oxoacyl-[acyl-carrier protein] reductase